jgi:mRNA interferase RelE/StbE
VSEHSFYRLAFEPKAWRNLMALSLQTQEQLLDAIESLELDPRPSGCKKLKEERGRLRIRSGDLRVIYEVHDEILLVLVVDVGNRRSIYKRRK